MSLGIGLRRRGGGGVCLDGTVEQNGTPLFDVAPGTTFPLVTKVNGTVANGTWNGTDTIDFTVAFKGTAFLLKTGETHDYEAGSDGTLEIGKGASWGVMSENNMYGNTNRFTDTVGGQTYANNIVLDHETRNAITGELLGYDKADVVTARTLTGMFTHASTKTVAGYGNWRLTNERELLNLRRQGTVYSWNYAPFNYGAGVFDYGWTSSSNFGIGGTGATEAWLIFNYSTVPIQSRAKSGSYFGMFCRTFTLTDAGVLT